MKDNDPPAAPHKPFLDPVNLPYPALVSQQAVRRVPRLALLLFCAAYVLPGVFGRDPWKNADLSAVGYMLSLARGQSDWLAPSLGHLPVRILWTQANGDVVDQQLRDHHP